MILQVGVKIIIQNSKQQILLIKRAEHRSLQIGPAIAWDVPGGRIEPDETLEIALQREVYEETGLELTKTPELIKAQDIIIPQKDLHVVRLTYLLKMDTFSVTLSDEHTDYRWVSLSELNGMPVENSLDQVLHELKSR